MVAPGVLPPTIITHYPSLFVYCLTLHIVDDWTRGVDSSLFSQLPQNHDRLRNVKAYHEFSYAYYKW
jgi:hypothetical protein